VPVDKVRPWIPSQVLSDQVDSAAQHGYYLSETSPLPDPDVKVRPLPPNASGRGIAGGTAAAHFLTGSRNDSNVRRGMSLKAIGAIDFILSCMIFDVR
jgi:hypothetical protein